MEQLGVLKPIPTLQNVIQHFTSEYQEYQNLIQHFQNPNRTRPEIQNPNRVFETHIYYFSPFGDSKPKSGLK